MAEERSGGGGAVSRNQPSPTAQSKRKKKSLKINKGRSKGLMMSKNDTTGKSFVQLMRFYSKEWQHFRIPGENGHYDNRFDTTLEDIQRETQRKKEQAARKKALRNNKVKNMQNGRPMWRI